jgi:hypothetical protein
VIGLFNSNSTYSKPLRKETPTISRSSAFEFDVVLRAFALVDAQLTTVQLVAVQSVQCGVRSGNVGEFAETVAFRTTSLAIRYQTKTQHLAGLRKQMRQVVLARFVGDIANKNRSFRAISGSGSSSVVAASTATTTAATAKTAATSVATTAAAISASATVSATASTSAVTATTAATAKTAAVSAAHDGSFIC